MTSLYLPPPRLLVRIQEGYARGVATQYELADLFGAVDEQRANLKQGKVTGKVGFEPRYMTRMVQTVARVLAGQLESIKEPHGRPINKEIFRRERAPNDRG